MTAAQPFQTPKDRFGCIELNLDDFIGESVATEDFEANLIAAVSHWKEDRVRCVTVTIPLALSPCITILAKHGFDFHHAQPGHATMLRWLIDDEPNNFPPYANHYIGVAGFVLNDKDEVLVVKERFSGPAGSRWKLPGGHADTGEHFSETARREVLEETGVESEFVALLCLRHMHRYRYGCSDIYAVCLMRATSSIIRPCPFEISDCAWIPLDEFERTTSTFNAKLTARCREYLSGGARMVSDQVPPLVGGKWSLLYFPAAAAEQQTPDEAAFGSVATADLTRSIT